MKPIIAALFLGLAAVLPLHADERTVNALQIVRTDGQTDWMKLSADMTIAPAADGQLQLTHPKVTAVYPLSQVKQMQFGYKNFATDKYYTGQNDASAQAPGLRFAITPAEIIAEGASSLLIYNVSGGLVASGKDRCDISALPHGIYIVNADSRSLKIVI